jgi:type VI protein secretion system component VasK
MNVSVVARFALDIVMVLAVFTIGAALVWGIMSWRRAKAAQDHHEDAAVAERQRLEDGETPPGTFAEVDESGRNWSKERGSNPPTPMPPRN